MKKLLALILVAVMLLSLTACVDFGTQIPVTTQPLPTVPPETQPPVGYEVGNLCPGYNLPVITGAGDTGNTIDPTKTGKVTVINFWGTWCGPCVSELPHLEELAKNYADTVTVIAVHSTQDWKQAPRFLANNYPDSSIVFSWESGNDYNGEYYLMMGGNGYYPYTVVLDENGIITETKVGSMSYEEMQQMVENAGAEPAVIETPSIPLAEVADAYSFSRETSYGATLCYHIPKVILPGDLAADVNNAIYTEFYPQVEEAETADEEFAYIMGMKYDMWQSGDLISLVLYVRQPYNDYVDYSVYNISAVTGQLLSDKEVYAHFGLSQEEGRAALVQYLDAYWEANPSTNELDAEYREYSVRETYSDEFLSEAKVFVGPDETLCFTAKIGVPAGAGHFNTLIDPNGELFGIYCGTPGHETY